MSKPIVIIESPYAGNVELNVKYARAAMKDCLLRGEAPYASHLLYTQEGVLDDTIPDERKLGIEAGFAFRNIATKTVVYNDLGISRGMEWGIKNSEEKGIPVEYRSLCEFRSEDSNVIEIDINQLRDLSNIFGTNLVEEVSDSDVNNQSFAEVLEEVGAEKPDLSAYENPYFKLTPESLEDLHNSFKNPIE